MFPKSDIPNQNVFDPIIDIINIFSFEQYIFPKTNPNKKNINKIISLIPGKS